jgi:hypothetical protein
MPVRSPEVSPMLKLAYTTLTLMLAVGPLGNDSLNGLISSSSTIRRGEAKADPTSNDRSPIKRKFVPIFMLIHRTIIAKKSLLALFIEQFRSINRTALIYSINNGIKQNTTR